MTLASCEEIIHISDHHLHEFVAFTSVTVWLRFQRYRHANVPRDDFQLQLAPLETELPTYNGYFVYIVAFLFYFRKLGPDFFSLKLRILSCSNRFSLPDRLGKPSKAYGSQ